MSPFRGSIVTSAPATTPETDQRKLLLGLIGSGIQRSLTPSMQEEAVIPLLDEVSDEARAIGAVNTVVFRDGRAIGYNTDGSGWAWGFRRCRP